MQNTKIFISLSQVLMTVFLLAGSAIAGETHKSIPARFQGLWMENLKQCGSLDDTQLKITAKELHFYESHGSVRSIKTEGKLELHVVADFSGEGEKWQQSLRFRLSKDQKRLTDITDNPPLVRYRCPIRKK
ncbi:MAG: hypothetical protein VKJ02_06405 [Snowella sp.]|nr:hypothetical protein [Snowella sp.]